MKQRPLKTTQHPRALTERELQTISGGTTLNQVPPPMPEINRNLK